MFIVNNGFEIRQNINVIRRGSVVGGVRGGQNSFDFCRVQFVIKFCLGNILNGGSSINNNWISFGCVVEVGGVQVVGSVIGVGKSGIDVFVLVVDINMVVVVGVVQLEMGN